MSTPRVTRRRFLKTASAAGVLAMTSHRVLGANERLRIGLIGCGSRANEHRKVINDLSVECNTEIVALCDVWKPALEQTAATVTEEFGVKPKTFQRYGDLLALKDVDAVVIATPDFSHSPVLIEAAGAGKHAYVEKPMATKLEDANGAVDAVVKSGIICQVGTQRRSHVPHQNALKIFRSGVLGKISEVECFYNRNTQSWERDASDVQKSDVDWEQFLMNAPQHQFDPRRYRCWHLYEDYTNGLTGLLGSHVIDAAHWFMEDPLCTCGVALGGNFVWRDGRELPDTLEALYLYPKGFMVRFVSRLGNEDCSPCAIFRGTNGTFSTLTLTADGQGGAGPDAIKEPIVAEGAGDPWEWAATEPHVKNWLECIRSGATPNADVHAGYAHSLSAIIAFESIKSGKRIDYHAQQRTLSA